MAKFKNNKRILDTGLGVIDLDTIDSSLLVELIQDCAMGITSQCWAMAMITPETVNALELLARRYWGIPSHIELTFEYGDKGTRLNTTIQTLGYLTVSAGKKKLFTMWQHLPKHDPIDFHFTNIQMVAVREYTEHATPARNRPNNTK